MQAAKRQAAGRDDILGAESTDGANVSPQTVFNLPRCRLVSKGAAAKSPGSLLETDEHLPLSPVLLRNHLHAVQRIRIKSEPRDLGWVSRPRSCSRWL